MRRPHASGEPHARNPDPTTRHLRTREVLDIRNGQGLAVRCLAGSLWITQDGDSDDVVLKTGECFVLDRRGLALVSAPVAPATVMVEKASRGAPCGRAALRCARPLASRRVKPCRAPNPGSAPSGFLTGRG
jgi:Protein of unknown function (DUF2917)